MMVRWLVKLCQQCTSNGHPLEVHAGGGCNREGLVLCCRHTGVFVAKQTHMGCCFHWHELLSGQLQGARTNPSGSAQELSRNEAGCSMQAT